MDAVCAMKMIILLFIYVTSDRIMRQNMDFIIAMSNKDGYLNTFLAMTCSPQSSEIYALFPGQKVTDRPDLAACVFKMKLRARMAILTDKKVFGNVKAYVSATEFQKRGLSHVHYIFTMTPHLYHDFAIKLAHFSHQLLSPL